MKLRKYLDMEKIKPARFAYEMNVSAATVYNWLSGITKPSIDHIQTIKKNTNNKVLPEDFYD